MHGGRGRSLAHLRARAMGEDVGARVFSRDDRQRYREKVRACLDVFARMLAEPRFHPERRSFGLEIELNLTDDAGDPAMANAKALEAIADPDFQTELGQFNVEINLAPRLLEGAAMTELERGGAGQPEQRRGAGPDGGRAHDDHRHPAHPHRGPAQRRQLQREPALRPAQRADLRGAGRGPAHLDRRPGAPGDLRRHHRARGGLHQRPAAPAGRPRQLRGGLERRPDHRGGADGHGGELALLLRPRAVARDPDRAVRAGHRHPPRGAEGPGGPAARVVRRALDHVDLRSVRGERALLPGPAAGVRRRGSRGDAALGRRARG